jgi:dipeptidyl aminopeptidase/acylaminoacyl peptidase
MLIFQGTSDSQVWIERVEALESEIAAKGAKCCLLKFPLAGHANDFVFNSNIGQVWTYYLERFLYITQ